MHVRHTIQAAPSPNIIDVRFDQTSEIFTTCTTTGFAIYRTWPLALLHKRDLPNGTLSIIQPMHTSSILFLVGGGRSPLYPPNKVVLWDDALGREVAELEFRERVLGLATRRDWLAVALKRRVVAFRIVDGVIARFHEWETHINPRGLVALASAPSSTLLAIPGRQAGHVQLVHLPPCSPPPPQPVQPPPALTPHPRPEPIPAPGPPPFRPSGSKAPVPIIAAHKASLTTLCVPPSGRLLATTSETGTLIRVWDSTTGKLVRELRRGSDKAEIYGVAFRGDESEVCVWSDKGTVHVFKIGEDIDASISNRHSTLSPLKPFIRLPKYFSSEWSYATYRLPGPTAHITLSSALAYGVEQRPSEDASEEEKCVVGWIQVPVRTSSQTGRQGQGQGHEWGTSLPVSSSQVRDKGKGKAREEGLATFAVPEADDGEQETMQYQLVALTYSGCWYRLSIPSPSLTSSSAPTSPVTSSAAPTYNPSPLGGTTHQTAPRSSSPAVTVPQSRDRTSLQPQQHLRFPSSSTSVSSPPSNVPIAASPPRSSSARRPSVSSLNISSKGKEKEKNKDDGGQGKASRQCVLEEFRRFGRWDGWG